MSDLYGTVTISNIEEFANKALALLFGKNYTFVSVYEYKRFEPETRTGNHLVNGNNGSPLSTYKENEYAGFNFCDTYGVWGLSTSTNDESYDPTFLRPYMVVTRNQITISQRTDANKIAHWQITVE